MIPVNVATDDDLYLLDLSDTPITGADLNDFTATATGMTSGATADVTLSEIGDGTYGVSFTPTTQERWLVTVDYDDGTTVRSFRQTYVVAGIRTRLGRGEYWVHAELLR